MKTTATLLVPAKSDPERDRVAQAWEAAGGRVLRVEKFWEKPHLAAEDEVAIYGNDTFVLVMAQVLGLELVTPNDSFITLLSPDWTKRWVRQRQMGALSEADFPLFVKPLIPKQFRAAVYPCLDALKQETLGLLATTELLTSEVIEIQSEARFFVLDGKVKTGSIYEGQGGLVAAETFAQAFVHHNAQDLPRTFVVDLAFNSGLGWVVLELNAVWGAGLNGCDPQKVIPCIAAATVQS